MNESSGKLALEVLQLVKSLLHIVIIIGVGAWMIPFGMSMGPENFIALQRAVTVVLGLLTGTTIAIKVLGGRVDNFNALLILYVSLAVFAAITSEFVMYWEEAFRFLAVGTSIAESICTMYIALGINLLKVNIRKRNV